MNNKQQFMHEIALGMRLVIIAPQKSRDLPGFFVNSPNKGYLASAIYAKFSAAKSQFTKEVKNVSTNLGRALR
jgi:hypothetical protein